MSSTTVQLPQRLTIEGASAALTSLQSATSQSQAPVVHLDASAMRDFDTSAVAVLLELRRRLRDQGKDVEVLNWPERLSALVRLYGVEGLLGVGAARDS